MIELRAYDSELQQEWDDFCRLSVNGTFLHSRRFLGYHGTRFTDQSLLLTHEGAIVGLFPAAVSPDDRSAVVSHPGATYGGLVHSGWLTGQRMITALELLRDYFRQRGFLSIRYKVVPHIYQTSPAQDDLYALFRVGADRIRSDLSSCIDLSGRRDISQRRRRALRKATASVTVFSGMNWLADFYSVLACNLAERYGATPVHQLGELQTLISLFPDEIDLRVALVGDQVVAGVLVFHTARVIHAQYIASSPEGYRLSALDAVFDASIQDGIRNHLRYFDFGTSNEEQGRVLNDGLYRYKTEFGGGGVAYDQYDIKCTPPLNS